MHFSDTFLAELADCAYQDTYAPSEHLHHPRHEHIDISYRGQVECPYCYHDPTDQVDIFLRLHCFTDRQHAVLAFRGTDRPIDWLANLDCRYCEMPVNIFSTLPGARLHNGFAHSWRAVSDQVINHLARRGITSISIVGHSKGAGEAQVALADLIAELRVLYILLIAPPRAGNRQFAHGARRYLASTGGKCAAYANGPDIVPRVPPSRFGYCHITVPVQLQRVPAWWLAIRSWGSRHTITSRYHGIDRYRQAMGDHHA